MVLKMNHDLAASTRRSANLDLRAEGVAELLLERRNLLALGSLSTAGARQNIRTLLIFRANLLAHDPLHVTDAQAVTLNSLGQGNLLVLVAQWQERAGVAGGNRALPKAVEDAAGQL